MCYDRGIAVTDDNGGIDHKGAACMYSRSSGRRWIMSFLLYRIIKENPQSRRESSNCITMKAFSADEVIQLRQFVINYWRYIHGREIDS